MAKNVVGNPWLFDAADQAEGLANAAVAGVVFDEVDPYVDHIVFESGAAGGDYDVRETDGGRPVSGIINLGANEQFQLAVGKRTGIYIEAFGSDGQILVYHGEP